MRFEGFVKSWNDDRAFGFIEPDQGGQDIFAHITAFPARTHPRPQGGHPDAQVLEVTIGSHKLWSNDEDSD